MPEVVIRYADSPIGHPLNPRSPVFEDPSQFWSGNFKRNLLLVVMCTPCSDRVRVLLQTHPSQAGCSLCIRRPQLLIASTCSIYCTV